MDADGAIYSIELDLQKMTCEKTSQPYVLPAHLIGNAISIAYNPFDSLLFMAVERDFCEILSNDFKSLARILKESENSFQGAKFLSAKTIVIWDVSGECNFYYLGPRSDLKEKNCVDLNDRDIVLISDGLIAIYVDKLSIGPYSEYHHAYNFASSKSNFNRSILIPATINSLNKQSFVHFSRDVLENVQIEISPFWASLFGSNMRNLGLGNGVPCGLHLKIATEKLIAIRDFWSIKNSTMPFTKMISVLKYYIAVGYKSGDISIIPHTILLLDEEDSWNKSRRCLLKGHRQPITALFVPEFKIDGEMCYLISGDKSGHIIVWNSKLGTQLGSFFDHSLAVLRFHSVPIGVGGRYKNSVLSIGQDNTVSIISLLDLQSTSYFGHGKGIIAIYWRWIDHNLMMIHCADGSLFVWHV